MKSRPLGLIFGLTCALALAVTLAYQGPTLVGQAPAGTVPRVVLIVKTTDLTISFWKALTDGARLGAQDLGLDLTIVGPADEADIDGQIRILEQTILSRPDAIVLAAADYQRLIQGVRRARAAGIPVATVDSFIISDDANTKIGTDNLVMGRTCAEALLRAVTPGSQVAVFSYIRESSTARDRERGLLEGLGTKVDILPTLYGGADAEVSYRQARELLATSPHLAGMVALNEPTTLGVSRALKESGRAATVALVGVDQSFPLLKSLEDGTIRNLLVQQPFNMGYLGVKAARTLIDGGLVEPTVDTGSVDIDRRTLFLPRNQELLFPVTEVDHAVR